MTTIGEGEEDDKKKEDDKTAIPVLCRGCMERQMMSLDRMQLLKAENDALTKKCRAMVGM